MRRKAFSLCVGTDPKNHCLGTITNNSRKVRKRAKIIYALLAQVRISVQVEFTNKTVTWFSVSHNCRRSKTTQRYDTETQNEEALVWCNEYTRLRKVVRVWGGKCIGIIVRGGGGNSSGGGTDVGIVIQIAMISKCHWHCRRCRCNNFWLTTLQWNTASTFKHSLQLSLWYILWY